MARDSRTWVVKRKIGMFVLLIVAVALQIGCHRKEQAATEQQAVASGQTTEIKGDPLNQHKTSTVSKGAIEPLKPPAPTCGKYVKCVNDCPGNCAGDWSCLGSCMKGCESILDKLGREAYDEYTRCGKEHCSLLANPSTAEKYKTSPESLEEDTKKCDERECGEERKRCGL